MNRLLAILLVLLAATPAKAQGFFIGGEASLIAYPLWDTEIHDTIVNNGSHPNTSTEVSGDLGAGIHAGQWINDNFGWEVGYDHMGNASGDFSFWDAAFTNYYDYSWKAYAKASHAAFLGSINFGRSKLRLKGGLYHASTTVDLTSTSPSITSRSWSNSNTGVLLGAGYSFAFTDHLVGNAGINLFNGVEFADLPSANMNNTRSENLHKIFVGVDYIF